MEQQIDLHETKIFHLQLPKNQIFIHYPSLAQSYLQKQENSIFLQKNQMENHIKINLIFIYKNISEDSIGYKIIKHQRLLMMLVKLSKKLSNFQKVQQVIKIQNPQGKNKKVINKQSIYSQAERNKAFYFQKCESIFMKMAKKYNSVICLLKLPFQSSRKLTVKEFISQEILYIKKTFSTKKLNQQQSQFKCKIKAQIISNIKKLSQKLSFVLQKFTTKLLKQAQRDQMIGQFLGGTNKFYKIDSFDLEKYFNIKYTKNDNRLNQFFCNAANNFFQYYLQRKSNNFSELNKQDLQPKYNSIELNLGWKWHEIEKTIYYLQSIYNLLIGRLTDEKSMKNEGQRRLQIIEIFCKQLRKQGVALFYEGFSDYLNNDDWIQIETSLQIDKTQMLTFNYKNIQTDNKNNGQIQIQQEKQQIRISGINQLNDKQYSLISLCDNESRSLVEQYNMDEVSSRQLLRQFNHYQLVSIYCFIECEKRWFFRNHKIKDSNTDDRYKSILKWLPLPNKNKYKYVQQKSNQNHNNYQNNINNNNSNLYYNNALIDYKTFNQYIGSLVSTYFQIKQLDKIKQFFQIKQLNRNNIKNHQSNQFNSQNNLFNKLINKDGLSLIEQQTKQSLDLYHIQQIPQSFLYNDIDNILVYNNKSFDNINHCHYYLKRINNDNRTQFDDKSWTQYLKQEIIKLYTNKIKSKPISNQLNHIQSNQNINSTINLISIPVRGRYCQHFDFFDLAQVYGQIFPKPYCQPEEISCPKCFADLPFDQIIYLKEVQSLIEMIKMFYLQQFNFDNYVLESRLRSNKKINNLKNFYIQKNKYKNQAKPKYILKDLKLIINHQTMSVKLNGKYLLKMNKKQDELKHQFQNSDFDYEQVTEIKFQQTLEQQVYQTLLNPNKNFKSVKRLKNFLQNYGRSRYEKNKYSQSEQHGSHCEDSNMSFEQRVETAKMRVGNRWEIYADLQKGTIAI